MSERIAGNKLHLAANGSTPQRQTWGRRQPTSAQATTSADPFAEEKTTAYKVPEELLRRARTGMAPKQYDEETGPDSGAITAPPPVEIDVPVNFNRVAPRAPGVPQDLLMSLRHAEHYDEEEVTVLRPNTTQQLRGAAMDESEGLRRRTGGDTDDVTASSARAANDAYWRSASEHVPRVRPGVSPVVLWLAVASVVAALAAIMWLIR